MNRTSKKIIYLISVVVFISFTLTAYSENSFIQIPLQLKASNILSDTQIKGSNYQIDDAVINDGLINLYTFTSEYGEIEAEGTGELHMRIDEFRAISVMEEMDRQEIFGEALTTRLKAPVKGAKALVTEPVETTKSAAKGLGQMFSNIGRAFVSDDPDQDNAAAVVLGYDVAKRQFAHELNINPYTDNEFAREWLGKISRSAVAGGIVPRAAMAAIDSTVITAARVTGTTKAMKELVRDNPPGKLDKINRKKLDAMGVSPDLAEAFLDNYTYDPYEETILVGRANETSVARYYRTMSQMMEAYHHHVQKAESIRTIKNALFLEREDGVIVLLAPVDYVFWTKKLESFLNNFEAELQKTKKVKGKEVWVAGKFDESAAAPFENRGWKIVEDAEDTLLKDL